MYRVSNGNTFTGKADLAKPYLVFTGKGEFTKSLGNDWNFMDTVQGGARVYFSKYIGQLKAFKKPLDFEYFDVVVKALDLQSSDLIHPALQYGYNKELIRLYPKANNNAQKQYDKFIDFLIDKYDLMDNNIEEKQNYIDDIGPYLVVRAGLKKCIIPEIPQVYLSPIKWRKMSWAINNYFIGPYPKNEKGIYFQWVKFDINSLIKNNADLSALYFLISKFIIIQEAWMDRPNCDSLLNFIDLIMEKNITPIDKKFIV